MTVKKYQWVIYPPNGTKYITNNHYSVEEVNDSFCGEYHLIPETEIEEEEEEKEC